jgi:hypothetical protein
LATNRISLLETLRAADLHAKIFIAVWRIDRRGNRAGQG